MTPGAARRGEPAAGAVAPSSGPARPLELLHVLAPASVGGLESVVASLASGQARRGHRVAVAAVMEPDGKLPRVLGELADAGVDVLRWRIPARAYLTELRRVREACARRTPDVVHTHGYRSDVVAGLAARSRSVATVSTVHGFTGGGLKNRAFEWLQRRSFRSFDAVVAVSAPLERELREAGVPARRLHLVRNAGVGAGEMRLLPRGEAREALGVDGRGFVTGFVGRLSREKGPDVLLDAVEVDPEPFGTVVLVGDGARRRTLEERAAGRGLGGRVRFAGEVPRASRLFGAFDLFVLSSRTEGTPVVLLEAMAAGVPVVAARVGGVPDVVGPGEDWLVPPEDPAALADAVREARRDPEAARRRAEAAAERLEREFGTEPWLDRYEAIYRQVAGAPVADDGASVAGRGP